MVLWEICSVRRPAAHVPNSLLGRLGWRLPRTAGCHLPTCAQSQRSAQAIASELLPGVPARPRTAATLQWKVLHATDRVVLRLALL